MLPICQVCLRTDRKLEISEIPLSNWHDELCDFAIEDFTQFCLECSYLLRKFKQFKEKCVLATKVLKNWKKQKPEIRKPLDQLKDELPPSSLGHWNKNNQRTYSYRAPELENEITAQNTEDLKDDTKLYQFPPSEDPIHNLAPTQVYNSTIVDTFRHSKKRSNGPDVKGIDMLIDNYQTFDYDNEESEIKVEHDLNEKSDVRERIVYKELQLKVDIDSDQDVKSCYDSDISDFDISQFNTLDDLNFDSSDDEVIKPKKSKTKAKQEDSDDKPPKRTKRTINKKPPNIEQLKNALLKRFANSGDIRDQEGNVIDKDSIISNLDKMHKYTLNQIKNRCTVPGSSVFSSEGVKLLSRLQRKYGNQYSSVFTIEHLLTKEQIMSEFGKRQYYEAYVSSEHKCALCYRGFKHKKLLEYHERMYHDESQPHTCSICQMKFKSRDTLMKHRIGHRAVYKCKLCPLVTNYWTAMVNHYHQHKGKLYVCELCKVTFKSKSCLSAHMNHMHQTQFVCPLCARNFASEFGLAQHRTRKHENEAVVENGESRKCEQCDITFVTEAVYMKHLEKSHAEQRSNVYVFKKRKCVNPRQRPNFVCRVCQKVEHSIGRLMWHFKYDHPTEDYELVYSDLRKHLCHICGKGFSNITDMNDHKHLHTGAKPYACDKCPKAFHRKINLRNHLERHLPPARECKHCGKKFVSAANLNNHIKMHIGIRRYTCEICSKSFLHRSALNAHVRGVHHHIRRARKPALKSTTDE